MDVEQSSSQVQMAEAVERQPFWAQWLSAALHQLRMKRVVSLTTYLFRSGHLLDLLVEDSLHPFAHLGNGMVWPIERDAITEDEANVLHDLVGGVVARVGGVEIRLRRVGGTELALDSGEVHWTLDDGRVVRYTESNGVNGVEEGARILHLLQRTDSRRAKAPLSH